MLTELKILMDVKITKDGLIIETRASIVEPRRTFRCCFVGGG